MFNGFTKEGLLLLKSFEKYNKKEFFESKREDYNRYILEPNRAYVQEMGEHLVILDSNINAIPKVNKSLFKIFRDSRFHINQPLKDKIGIIFWEGSDHRMQSSSFYLNYTYNNIFWSVGVRNFKPPLLKSYREYIKDNRRRELLHTILQKIENKGYIIPEVKYKRVPIGFNNEDKYSYLYKMGAIYAYQQSPIQNDFYSKKIVDKSFKYYSDMIELFEWVKELVRYSKSKNV